jgi:hypothetical protein
MCRCRFSGYGFSGYGLNWLGVPVVHDFITIGQSNSHLETRNPKTRNLKTLRLAEVLTTDFLLKHSAGTVGYS